MSFTGHMENGRVVFDAPVPLPNGTQVRVVAIDEPYDFWTPLSLDELAERQGVEPVSSVDDYFGGWPEDKLDDGFEEAFRKWREER